MKYVVEVREYDTGKLKDTSKPMSRKGAVKEQQRYLLSINLRKYYTAVVEFGE